MNKVLLHGENVFKPVNTIPKGKVSKYKTFIAGHSESGHHHILECEKEFMVTEIEQKGEKITYVDIIAIAKVIHKKSIDIHETRTLSPGKYQIIPAVEYNPFTKIMQRQFD